MVILLSILLFFSLAINGYLYIKRRSNNAQLQYICMKLQHIVHNQTEEKVLLYTDNVQLQQLLIHLNELIDRNQKATMDYVRMKASMRRMLSNISHDLKTPLTVILGYTEMLTTDDKLNREQVNALLQIVNAKAEEVIGLIQSFFELSKLEADDKQLTLSAIHINELCRKKILEYYDMTASHAIEVAVHIPEETYIAQGSALELERVLDNLISNGIKYGSDGKYLELTVRADQHKVYIEISDQGKGIDEGHQEHVFERMYTLDDARNRNNQGSGLGLTITKTLLEKMGGAISLKSKPFEKTTFTIELRRILS